MRCKKGNIETCKNGGSGRGALISVAGDNRRGSCSRCAKNGIQCIRVSDIRFRHGTIRPCVSLLLLSLLLLTRFPSPQKSRETPERHAQFEFSDNQQWVSTKGGFNFVDETRDVMTIYDLGSSPSTSVNLASSAGQVYAGGVEEALTGSTLGDAEGQSSDHHRSHLTPGGQSWLPNEPRNEEEWATELPQSPVTLEPEVSAQGETTLVRRGMIPHQSILTHESLQRTSPSFVSFNADPYPHNEPPAVGTSPLSTFYSRTTPSWTDLTEGGSPAASVHMSSDALLAKVYSPSRAWSLNSKGEAGLVRHFVDRVSQDLDITDPLQHFAKVVPRRAQSYPVLLNAMLAAAARHLSRTGDYHPYIADQ